MPGQVQFEAYCGHRERQRRSLLLNGGESLSDLEVLEMLLYYILPRIDTKPIADELLSRFGSINGVLNANPNEMKEIRGLTANAEVLFALLRQVSLRDEEGPVRGDFRDIAVAADYLLDVYKGAETESVYAIYIDQNGSRLDSGFVFRGGVNSSRFPLRVITEGVLRCHASGVILAHNHPSGSVIPSGDDLTTTDMVLIHLAANDINLVEHYIVGRSECMGIINQTHYKA